MRLFAASATVLTVALREGDGPVAVLTARAPAATHPFKGREPMRGIFTKHVMTDTGTRELDPSKPLGAQNPQIGTAITPVKLDCTVVQIGGYGS